VKQDVNNTKFHHLFVLGDPNKFRNPFHVLLQTMTVKISTEKRKTSLNIRNTLIYTTQLQSIKIKAK
jgi:hypothetical protein